MATGTWLDQHVIDGDDILDLEIEPAPISQPDNHQAQIDPAILSFTRSPVRPQSSSISQLSGPNFSIHESEAFRVSPLPKNFRTHGTVEPYSASVQPLPDGIIAKDHWPATNVNIEDALASATLSEPFNDLVLSAHVAEEQQRREEAKVFDPIHNPQAGASVQTGQEAPKAKGRRHRARKGTGKIPIPSEQLKDVPQTISPESPPNPPGSGWRQTPLIRNPSSPSQKPRRVNAELDLQSSAPIHQPTGGKRRARARQRNKARRSEYDDQNGWATEEVTDIQDMGDFDFEGNLSKFDKRKVFEKIREEDTTADEDRLVSFNRTAARPGTYGGKNLHFTENVLDPPTLKHFALSSSESELDALESHMNSSRSSHRNQSRPSTRKVPSRKGSGVTNGYELHRTNTAQDKVRVSHATSTVPSNRSAKDSSHKPKRIVRTASSQRDCPCLSPLQMMELEQLVVSRMGVTEDMITENAASAIAQTARQLCLPQVNHKAVENNTTPRPLIVILTGNHKTGSRAIAAARQLRNHNAQVLLCVLGLQRENDLLEGVRRQLTIFRNGGGRTLRPDQLLQGLSGASTSLLVDAMLGIHMSFHDLRHEDQAAYLQLLRWSNSINAQTLAIDIPSGVDASTGNVISLFSSPLCPPLGFFYKPPTFSPSLSKKYKTQPLPPSIIPLLT